MIEYFVPRSVSEFDLSITGNELVPTVLPLTTRMMRKVPVPRTREKMVTFEDELAAKAKGPDLQDVFM